MEQDCLRNCLNLFRHWIKPYKCAANLAKSQRTKKSKIKNEIKKCMNYYKNIKSQMEMNSHELDLIWKSFQEPRPKQRYKEITIISTEEPHQKAKFSQQKKNSTKFSSKVMSTILKKFSLCSALTMKHSQVS